MKNTRFCCCILLVMMLLALAANVSKSSTNLPHGVTIIIVYTLQPEKCRSCEIANYTLEYIQMSLEHLALIQTRSNILLASDIEGCAIKCGKKMDDWLELPEGVQYVDANRYIDNEKNSSLAEFKIYSSKAFASEFLWLSSATRFFILESLMKEYSISNVIHIEVDNLLYGQFDEVFTTLRDKYHSLAATPLYLNSYIITASVLWIPNHLHMGHFNTFLTNCLGKDDALWRAYLKWMRKHACCRKGGMDPDEKGHGIYNRSVNEMSVLGYYKYLNPEKLASFPLIPLQQFVKMKFMSDDLNAYRPGGANVRDMLGFGIFDSGSYGQYLGGTSYTHDTRGFSEPKHLIGMALRLSSCRPVVLCTNHNFSLYRADSSFKVVNNHILSLTHQNYSENLSRFPITPIVGGTSNGMYNLLSGISAGKRRWAEFKAFHANRDKVKLDDNIGRTLVAVKCSASLTDYEKLVNESLKRNFNPFPLKLPNEDDNLSELFKEVNQIKDTVTTITPLWNIHVHSKLTWEFVTSLCRLQ